jgi:hypothetical protein
MYFIYYPFSLFYSIFINFSCSKHFSYRSTIYRINLKFYHSSVSLISINLFPRIRLIISFRSCLASEIISSLENAITLWHRNIIIVKELSPILVCAKSFNIPELRMFRAYWYCYLRSNRLAKLFRVYIESSLISSIFLKKSHALAKSPIKSKQSDNFVYIFINLLSFNSLFIISE